MRKQILNFFGALPEIKENITDRYNAEMRIVMDIATPWFIMCFAFMLSFSSFVLDFLTGPIDNWFGRSGAVLVAAGTWNELMLAKHSRWFDEDILHLQHNHTNGYNRFFHWSKKNQKVAWLFIGFGTLIWAYGDLVFTKILCHFM